MDNLELKKMFEGVRVREFVSWAREVGVDIKTREVHDHLAGRRVITKFPELSYRQFFRERGERARLRGLVDGFVKDLGI